MISPVAITVDSAGSAYVAGWTNSSNLPLKCAFQTTIEAAISESAV